MAKIVNIFVNDEFLLKKKHPRMASPVLPCPGFYHSIPHASTCFVGAEQPVVGYSQA